MRDHDQTPQRLRRVAAALGCAAVTVAAVVVAPAGGFAATAKATDVSFVGYAGGTLARAANQTVTSQLTASSELNTFYSPVATSNSAAAAAVPSLVSAGAVTTSVRTETLSGGYRVVSTSRTAGVDALGGAIRASAIETTSVATVLDGEANAKVDTDTKLVGLTIAGKAIPVTVPRNFPVQIPGIATVAVNYAQLAVKGRTALSIGMGLYVSLLRPMGNNAIGAELAISPTYAALAPVTVPESGRYLGGRAYGTSVRADVGSLAGVVSDQTAPVALDVDGTNNVDRTANIAAVTLAPALRVGAIRSTANGVNSKTRYTARTRNEIAGVNLLNGAITARALTATAQVTGIPNQGAPAVTGSATVAGLVIGGRAIPLNAAPNTTIRLGSLATVVVNQQVRTANSITVRALVITLNAAAYGLPAGAEVQVASSSASVA